MKFLRDLKEKIKASKLFRKMKNVKNIEIIFAALLAAIAAVCFFAISAGKRHAVPTSVTNAEMTEAESRLAGVISEISGIGKAKVLITTGKEAGLIGVVVVAQGASAMENRIKMIRCVEKATGATVDQIEIFEMSNGG